MKTFLINEVEFQKIIPLRFVTGNVQNKRFITFLHLLWHSFSQHIAN